MNLVEQAEEYLVNFVQQYDTLEYDFSYFKVFRS